MCNAKRHRGVKIETFHGETQSTSLRREAGVTPAENQPNKQHAVFDPIFIQYIINKHSKEQNRPCRRKISFDNYVFVFCRILEHRLYVFMFCRILAVEHKNLRVRVLLCSRTHICEKDVDLNVLK
jgi:hypothetical protein